MQRYKVGLVRNRVTQLYIERSMTGIAPVVSGFDSHRCIHMQTHFSERQSFAVQSRSSVFTYGNDGYKRDGTGRQDGLSRTLKPAAKGNLLELHESDCGFESHRTLSYKNTLTCLQVIVKLKPSQDAESRIKD